MALWAMAVAPSRLARLTPAQTFATQRAFGPKAPAAVARPTSASATVSDQAPSGSAAMTSRVPARRRCDTRARLPGPAGR
jgi:hypothetical protein